MRAQSIARSLGSSAGLTDGTQSKMIDGPAQGWLVAAGWLHPQWGRWFWAEVLGRDISSYRTWRSSPKAIQPEGLLVLLSFSSRRGLARLTFCRDFLNEMTRERYIYNIRPFNLYVRMMQAMTTKNPLLSPSFLSHSFASLFAYLRVLCHHRPIKSSSNPEDVEKPMRKLRCHNFGCEI